MIRELCICADDFGLSPGINAAVLDLAARSRISATGCMVRRGAWAAGLAGLRGLDATRVEVGLHLDFSAPARSDAPERGLAGLVARSYLGLLRPDAVRAEIREQLTRFEDGLGRAPAFVDGHRHVHQLPVLREALADEVAGRYGHALPWLRNTAPGDAPRRGAKAALIHALGGRGLGALAARRGIPTSRGLLGVYGLDGSIEAYRARLAGWIDACRSGDVLMCHPSRGDADAPVPPHDRARRHEYAVLGALAFPLATAEGSVVLARPAR